MDNMDNMDNMDMTKWLNNYDEFLNSMGKLIQNYEQKLIPKMVNVSTTDDKSDKSD